MLFGNSVLFGPTRQGDTLYLHLTAAWDRWVVLTDAPELCTCLLRVIWDPGVLGQQPVRTLQTDTEGRAELPAGGLRPLQRHAVRLIRAETAKWISDGRPRLASSQTKTSRAVSTVYPPTEDRLWMKHHDADLLLLINLE